MVHHGKITKRGPEELRTALVQVVMGIRRYKKTTVSWRRMLSRGEDFNPALMTDRNLAKKAASIRVSSLQNI
jgi:hypothetical protein